MKDKSLDILMMVLFGISGTAVLILAWLHPALESDRISATLAGSIGLFIALLRALKLKRLSLKANH
ncbi:hypothetical protein ACFLV0_01455 [Chloroflexota bacterium]